MEQYHQTNSSPSRIAVGVAIIISMLVVSSCTPAVRFTSSVGGATRSPAVVSSPAKSNTKDNRTPLPQTGGIVLEGQASFYADKFVGRPTATGEIYSHGLMTAAHRDLPFGTYLEVENLRNKRKVRVRINDRGPFVAGRILDLSKGAAEAIGMVQDGVVPIRATILSSVQ